MDDRLKQRMVGALVLIALGVIFIPIVLDESGRKQQLAPIPSIPEEPEAPEPVPLIEEPIVLQKEVAVELPSKPPESPVPADPAPPAGVDTGDLSAWVVQLGSFGEQANARKLTDTLQKSGFDAFIEPVDTGAEKAYRVRVGPMMTRQKADQIRKRIKNNHKKEGVVMRYRGPEGG